MEIDMVLNSSELQQQHSADVTGACEFIVTASPDFATNTAMPACRPALDSLLAAGVT